MQLVQPVQCMSLAWAMRRSRARLLPMKHRHDGHYCCSEAAALPGRHCHSSQQMQHQQSPGTVCTHSSSGLLEMKHQNNVGTEVQPLSRVRRSETQFSCSSHWYDCCQLTPSTAWLPKPLQPQQPMLVLLSALLSVAQAFACVDVVTAAAINFVSRGQRKFSFQADSLEVVVAAI